jgi:three-Cys-motif partner protein
MERNANVSMNTETADEEDAVDIGAMEAAVFHSSKKPPAILKHAILDKYLPPFVGKTGSTSKEGRVAFVDAYAGPGRYDDGNEGSGALVLRQAKAALKIKTGRQLIPHLVERDRPTIDRLREVVAREGVDLECHVYPDDFSDATPEILTAVSDMPCLFYVDPCGLLIPFEDVVALMNRTGVVVYATELLLNFNASSLRRIAGHLTSDKAVAATLQRMDEICGGEWWREAWMSRPPDRQDAEGAVIEGYMNRLTNATKGYAWAIDVRQRPDLLPKYYLIFVTRHADGFTHFGETASKALEEWRRALAEIEAANTLLADDGLWETVFKEAEAALADYWNDIIFTNLVTELRKGKPFRVIDKYEAIYGSVAGVARSMHVRAAWKKAFAEGLAANSPVGVKELLYEIIRPGACAI